VPGPSWQIPSPSSIILLHRSHQDFPRFSFPPQRALVIPILHLLPFLFFEDTDGAACFPSCSDWPSHPGRDDFLLCTLPAPPFSRVSSLPVVGLPTTAEVASCFFPVLLFPLSSLKGHPTALVISVFLTLFSDQCFKKGFSASPFPFFSPPTGAGPFCEDRFSSELVSPSFAPHRTIWPPLVSCAPWLGRFLLTSPGGSRGPSPPFWNPPLTRLKVFFPPSPRRYFWTCPLVFLSRTVCPFEFQTGGFGPSLGGRFLLFSFLSWPVDVKGLRACEFAACSRDSKTLFPPFAAFFSRTPQHPSTHRRRPSRNFFSIQFFLLNAPFFPELSGLLRIGIKIPSPLLPQSLPSYRDRVSACGAGVLLRPKIPISSLYGVSRHRGSRGFSDPCFFLLACPHSLENRSNYRLIFFFDRPYQSAACPHSRCSPRDFLNPPFPTIFFRRGDCAQTLLLLPPTSDFPQLGSTLPRHQTSSIIW